MAVGYCRTFAASMARAGWGGGVDGIVWSGVCGAGLATSDRITFSIRDAKRSFRSWTSPFGVRAGDRGGCRAGAGGRRSQGGGGN